MYDNLGNQPGGPRPPINAQQSPFGNAFYGVGTSGLIRGGLGAHGEKILGSCSEYVQSNGHWTRITKPMGGRLSNKPPIYDINASDLYIPFTAFGTYIVLACFSWVFMESKYKFSSEALNWLFIKGLVGRFLQVSLLKMSLFSLGSGEAPLLDIVAYAGYTFTGNVSGCPLKDFVELLFDAMDMLMHGNFLGEDNEESFIRRGEDIRFKQAPLPLGLHCFS